MKYFLHVYAYVSIYGYIYITLLYTVDVSVSV